MSYVEGFVVPVPKARLEDYRRVAALTAEVWKEQGVLSYVECVGEDTPVGEVTSFPRSVQLKEDEVVVFSWIRFRDKAHRDAAMAAVMEDERFLATMADLPFDAKRMIFGGFSVLLEI